MTEPRTHEQCSVRCRNGVEVSECRGRTARRTWARYATSEENRMERRKPAYCTTRAVRRSGRGRKNCLIDDGDGDDDVDVNVQKVKVTQGSVVGRCQMISKGRGRMMVCACQARRRGVTGTAKLIFLRFKIIYRARLVRQKAVPDKPDARSHQAERNEELVVVVVVMCRGRREE